MKHFFLNVLLTNLVALNKVFCQEIFFNINIDLLFSMEFSFCASILSNMRSVLNRHTEIWGTFRYFLMSCSVNFRVTVREIQRCWVVCVCMWVCDLNTREMQESYVICCFLLEVWCGSGVIRKYWLVFFFSKCIAI